MTQHITQEVAETIRESCYGQSNLSEFYRAMMNAAIQWDRDQRAKDLPELPDPYGIGAYPYPDTFTRAQTFTYGQQCAAHAREMALNEAKLVAKTTCHHESTEFANGFNMAALNIESAIEALKGK